MHRQTSRAPLPHAAWAAATAGALFAFSPLSARADEPRKVTEPWVMREPSEIVQVADAFDDDDIFDLHLSLGYEHTWKNAKIYRESSMPQISSGDFTPSNMNVAKYSEELSRLNTRADIGVYKDLAIVIRLPVILSDDRNIQENGGGLQSTTLAGLPGEQLFSLPFKSPSRSGIEYLALGMDAGVMNQARNPNKPTWVIGGEVRVNVSEPMHACNANPPAGEVKCATPNDMNRDGVPNQVTTTDTGVPNQRLILDEGSATPRKPGVSRGTTGLAFHTFISRRVKYVEPYGGFDVLFEFPNGDSDYHATDLKGSLVNHPPLRGTMTVGIAVIPWEIRDAFQRVTLDARFEGSYVSEGRDYSELFDALGSSDAPSLRTPQFSDYMANPDPTTRGMYPSVVDPNSQKVYFTGLTDVQQHGEYVFSARATYQAGEYVKFNVGGGYQLIQGHFITFDQACNPAFSNSTAQMGPCRNGDQTTGYTPSGIPNPNYRKVINDPGRRFKVDDVNGLDAWISATVMF
ncbi:MAG TPA: hypothetical protein VMI54_05435 [Polyangiaceae bacterium]|nr:hypothetical protein [Polyangiaceae bacterium]